MWTEKYRPNRLSLMVGNENARLSLYHWLKNWKQGIKPALLLGPPGVGKTTVIHILAKEFNYTVWEFNASDIRNKQGLETKLSPLFTHSSLYDENKLIFLDEVDGIFPRYEHGAIDYIDKITKNSKIPIILAANFSDNQSILKLFRKCTKIQFFRVPNSIIKLYLQHIMSKENLEYSDVIINEVLENSNGELRAAINNLQSIGDNTTDQNLSNRDIIFNLEDSLDLFFNSNNVKEAYYFISNSKSNAKDKLNSAYYRILNSEISSKQIFLILNSIVKLDKILGNIKKTNDWRFLRYFDKLMGYSLFPSTNQFIINTKKYEVPWNIKLRIWNDGKLLIKLANKLGKLFHASQNDVMNFYLPYIFLLSKNTDFKLKFFKNLNIDESTSKVIEKEIKNISSIVEQ